MQISVRMVAESAIGNSKEGSCRSENFNETLAVLLGRSSSPPRKPQVGAALHEFKKKP
jgi:hypothetical protein